MTLLPDRSQRVLRGLGVQTIGQVLVLAVTFLVVPLTLDRLGEEQFGLWVVAFGTLNYLALADFGLGVITAREIARGVGRKESADRLRDYLERSLHLLFWFSFAAAAVFLAMDHFAGPELNAKWVPMREPYLAMVLGYFLAFPLGLFGSALTGLGDLGFYWVAVAAQQLLGATVTVALLLAGCGLWAMVWGYLAGQFLVVLLLVIRLAWKFPAYFPRRPVPLFQPATKPVLAAGSWYSITALGNVFLGGLDLLILGTILDPLFATVYILTTRLPSTLSRQLLQVIGTVMPSLAEAGAERTPGELAHILKTVFRCQAVMVGFAVVLVAGVNEAFLAVWLRDRSLFGGHTLNAVFLAGMFVRQWQAMSAQMLFSLGFNRLVPIGTLADGILTAVLMIAFVGPFGMIGVPFATILGAVLVSLPINLAALGRTVGISMWDLSKPIGEWLMRSLPIFPLCAAVAWACHEANDWRERLAALLLGSALIGMAYLAAMLPMLRGTPLASKLPRFLRGNGIE